MRSVSSFQFSAFSRMRKIAKRFSALPAATAFLCRPHQTPSALNTQRGYSLVEVLVAITVLLIALVGPLTIAHSGLKRAYTSREQTMAVFLAQEGLEAVAKVREDNALSAYPDLSSVSTTWNNVQAIGDRCTTSSPCGVTVADDGSITSASFYNCNASNCVMRYSSGVRVPYKQGTASGTVSPYERRISMNVDSARVAVTSTVTWGALPSQSVSLQTYFYNIYTAEEATPTGGGGTPQSVGNTQGPYASSETGPRGTLRDAMEASCGNCGMTALAGSPNNNALTRARLCVDMFGPGSTVESYVTGSYSSPSNNYIFSWNGSAWISQSAPSAGNNLIKGITCLTN